MKLLDAGALGIVCPMVYSREQAEALVSYCRYARTASAVLGDPGASRSRCRLCQQRQ